VRAKALYDTHIRHILLHLGRAEPTGVSGIVAPELGHDHRAEQK